MKKKLNKRSFIITLLFSAIGGILVFSGFNEKKAEKVISKLRLWIESFERRTERPKFAKKENIPQRDFQKNPVSLSEKNYRAFLASLNLKYIKPREVLRPHFNKRYGVKNSLPPRELWQNIARTLEVADLLRQRLSSPLKVISVYRSPAYNSAISGASKSQHMRNRALDIRFECSSKEAFNMAKKLRAEGVFSGGIGYYNSFIHIDTRGINVSWGDKA